MTIIKQGKGKKTQITLSGDKSISHRLILMSLLNHGAIEIENLSNCEDVKTSLQIFKQLGGQIETDQKHIALQGLKSNFATIASELDCKNSATTARLLCGILAGQEQTYTLTGDRSLKKRPMYRIIQPLQKMGATITHNQGNLPLTITGTSSLESIIHELPVASAQLKTAIMFAALQAKGVTLIKNTGSSRNHTENLLNYFQISFKESIAGIQVSGPQKLERSFKYKIPGDISTAAFFIVAAVLLPESDILIKDVLLNDGRIEFIKVLKKMGASIDMEVTNDFIEPVGTVRVRYSPDLNAIEIHGDQVVKCIDEIPALIVAMAYTNELSEIREAAELRNKESDRIKSMCTALKTLGVDIHETKDGCKIRGNPELMPEGQLNTFSDHRIAAALSIFALKSKHGLELNNIDCIKISFPEFSNIFLPAFNSET